VLAAAEAALRALSRANTEPLRRAIALLAAREGTIIVSGVGKSAWIAGKAAATLTSLGQRAVTLDPLAALHGDSGVAGPGDVLVAISFSGESVELVKTAKHLAKIAGIPTIAITHGKASPLAKLAAVVIDIPVAKEGSPHELAPMASTTVSLVITDMIAAALTEPERFTRSSFAQYHPGGSLGLSLVSVNAIMRPLAETPRVVQSAPLGDALDAMTRGGLGATAVVSARGRLVGIVTDGDVRRILLTRDAPKALPVERLMTKSPKTVRGAASLKDALSLMERYKITSLFVTGARGALAGIIHMHDIIERGL
jgi:arabinose-5-phosphate isomerase